MSKKNNTLVIVLNWNGKEDTLKCVESLQHQPCDVVIVDNGSSDDSFEFFKKNCLVTELIQTKENLGFAGGTNVGIQWGLEKGYAVFLILNNDTIAAPDLITSFLKTFELNEAAGILGAKIYLMDQPNTFDHFGGTWNKKQIDFTYLGRGLEDDGVSFEESIELDYVCGASIMIKKEVFEKIGTFDPRFFFYFEETDFCFRAKRAGFLVMTAPKAKIWHKVGASFKKNGGKPLATYFFWRNRLLWVEKNFSGMKRALYFTRLLFFNCLILFGEQSLRFVQLIFQKMAGKSRSRSIDRLAQNRARLIGTADFLTRKFGKGRSHLFIKNN